VEDIEKRRIGIEHPSGMEITAAPSSIMPMWKEVPLPYAMPEQGPTLMLAIRFPLLISFVSCPKPSSLKTSFHSSL
jgi:hypothetical protein